MKFAVILLSLLATQAFAKPMNQQMKFDGVAAVVSDEVFEGIVKIDGCSASVVKFKGQDPKSLAMVMTNDHCLDDQAYKTYTFNRPYAKAVKIYDKKKQFIARALTSTRIIYATQTHTDMALMEIPISYAELESKFGVRAFELSNNLANVGDEVLVITGYFGKAIDCSIDGFVYKIVESTWFWKNSYRYVNCDTGHGTSGSPIVLKGTREIVGINNTGNDEGKKCTLNNPCEVNETGVITATKGAHYGQQINDVYSCLDRNMKFDIKIPSCELFGGAAFTDFEN
jgi:hypothetical protein